MENLVTDLLSQTSGVAAYGLVLVVLLLCGLGVPLPEDVALITGGFLVYKGEANLPMMIAIAFIGILGGDSFAYLLGRRFGDRLTRVWPFRLVLTPAKRTKVEHLFARYGEKIVMAARFMPGVRAVTYFFAGAAGMRYLRFIAFDGLAALVSAPVFVVLGWYFGGKIDWLVGAVRRGQGAVLGAVAGVVVSILVARYIRGRLARRAEAKAPSAEPAPSVSAERSEDPKADSGISAAK